ncbi:MAG: hypothetical protein SNJ70_00165 [Armatimonadota bacterium]
MSNRFYKIVLLIIFLSVFASVIVYLSALKDKEQDINTKSNTPEQRGPATDDPWQLLSDKPDFDYGTYLANGYISTQIKGSGLGFEKNEPLQCFVAGLYNEETLVPIPTWSDIRITNNVNSDDALFQIDAKSFYTQTLDIKKGILTTKCTYRYQNQTLQGEIKIIVSRARKNIALITFDFVPNFDGNITFYVPSYLDEQGKSKFAYFDVIENDICHLLKTKESNLYLAIYTFFHSDSILQSNNTDKSKDYIDRISIKAEKNKRFKVLYLVSISVDMNSETAVSSAKNELEKAIAINIEDIEEEHISAWNKIWERRIIIDGPKKDQQTINSCMFYILQSVREDMHWSIPPLGLSSNGWSGHIFWDADLWIFHAIALQFPEFAKSIVEYRYKTLDGARQNAVNDGFKGAQFAWESGFTGIEATPEGLVYRHERHINGNIALAQWQYYLITKDKEWLKKRGYNVIKETADYWVSKVTYNEDKDRYEILEVVPPDENRDMVNNSVYTNVIAKLNLLIAAKAAETIGQTPSPRWVEIANKMYIPFDEKNQRFVAHDNDEGLAAKQADTELVIFPLQYKISGKTQEEMKIIYKNTYEYYAPKVHKGGPAMAPSAHSVILARLGNCADAYEKFHLSYKPYFRGPFNNFNEKPSLYNDVMTFLTGAAGPIKATIFGFAGLEFEYLSNNNKLFVNPCLPIDWNSITIKSIHFNGKKYDLTVYEEKYDLKMLK